MAQITRDVIDCEALMNQVRSPTCGALLLFTGTTREFTGNHQTQSLEYEAYEEMAIRELEKLELLALEKFPIERCRITHRLGKVPVGETSVAVATGSPHRTAAFEACQWVMNELKARVPIWKRDVSMEGRVSWVPNSSSPVNQVNE